MKRTTRPILALLLMTAFLLIPGQASAHCDTIHGPVVQDARKALEAGDATPVLKWVDAGDETEVREAFARTLTVRAASAEARELADRYFFETVVRLHRASEGMPYTGLKDEMPEAIIVMADEALAEGSVETMRERVIEHVGHTLDERFHAALSARGHAGDTVEAGREYVEAYVQFTHFAEAIHQAAAGEAAHAAPTVAGHGQ